MSYFKYKIGDRVRIKSLDWYNDNKDEYGYVNCPYYTFFAVMCQYCGKTLTISSVDKFDKKYEMKEDGGHYRWTDEMIEGLVEDNYQSDSFPSNDTKSRIKWEYKEIEISSVNNNTSYFNEFGEQGWEMCGYDSKYGMAVFKRIKR